MLKNTLLHKLYSYNMHIGSITFYNSRLNYYIFGKRFNFYIINLNKSFLLLKKAIFFLDQLAFHNGSALFYYTNYKNLSVIYKCVLLSIAKTSHQQMITHKWDYGKIGNFFFSFYLLIKDITSLWVKRQNYLFNLEKQKNHFYNTSVEYEHFEHFDYLFLKRWKTKKWWKGIHTREKRYRSFRKWYRKWMKSSATYKFITFKTNSYRYTNFFKKLCLNDINNIWKRKKLFNFKYLFLKLFYYIHLKKKDPFTYNIYSDKFFDLKTKFVYNKFQSYWRFILYFKYFNNYYNVPDALICIFPNKDDLPLKEYHSNGLVSIGVVDTDCNISNINYPIISNDDSLVIVIFYFTLFSNLFLENKINIYNILDFKI